MTPEPLAIYGTGGAGRELAWQAEDTGAWRVVAYVDDDPAKQGRCIGAVPVVPLPARPCDAIAVAIGTPFIRRTMVEKAEAAGYSVVGIRHHSAIVAPSARVGDGLVLCMGSVISVDCTIGRHVRIDMGSLVHHDANVGDYVTISPRVTVCGHVEIHEEAFIGAGATIKNGTPGKPLVICAGAVVGAGAVVTEDVPSGVTVVGVPARAKR